MPFVHNKVKKGLMCVLGKGGRDLIYMCIYGQITFSIVPHELFLFHFFPNQKCFVNWMSPDKKVNN
jgi:hypothetical protein